MANALYPKTKARFFQAGLDLSSVNVRAILVTSGYAYSAAHDFLDDVPGGAVRVAVSPNLAGKTFGTDASFDSDDPIFTAVTDSAVAGIILYNHTGADATSELIAFLDTGVTGLPLTPDGSDVQIVVDSGGWFRL
jgi:hypothetical protein